MPRETGIMAPARQRAPIAAAPGRRRLLPVLCACAFVLVVLGRAPLAEDELGVPSTERIVIEQAGGGQRAVSLPLNKARMVRLPVDARDVIVANPDVVDVILKSPRLVYLLGNQVGSSNVILLSGGGEEIVRLDVSVESDMASLRELLRQLVPGEDIDITSVNENVALSGTVMTPEAAESAQDIAERFVPAENIVNLLKVRNSQQVLLKVKFAEVSREVVKEFGIDTEFIANFTNGSVSFITGTGATANTFGSGALNLSGSNQLDVVANALERNGLVKILAEPNVTAISGELATVLVGGEFPIPVPGGDNTITIDYRRFGVVLEFTPVVLSDGRISLHVNTEVSRTSEENAVVIEGFAVPSLVVRRATTSVDLPSGGALVIAGLLQNNINTSLDGLPGLKDIPVLGTLFRSQTFQRDETELVVMVTPYIVRPFDPSDAAFPTDGLIPSNDFERYLLGRLHRQYGDRREIPESGAMQGPIGFIVE